METNYWTRDELVAYVLLFAANSDFIEHNKERNVIISKVDMKTFQDIHDEFDADNDYQSIKKIKASLKQHQYDEDAIELLLADIKALFLSDGIFNRNEKNMYMFLEKILKK